jgi:hypothetical protein
VISDPIADWVAKLADNEEYRARQVPHQQRASMSMINEAAYREWQAWIRDLSPRKPVLIDTIWSLDRPIQRAES